MAYDANGNLTSQTDAKGQPITFTYDALNRVTLKTVGTAANRVETRFTYDQVRAGYYNKGRLTSQEVTGTGGGAAIHRIENDYHQTGALQALRHILNGRTYTFANAIAADGSVQDMTVPSHPNGSTSGALGPFTYDAAGRLTAWPGYVTSASYDLRGNRTAITYANGASEAATFDLARGWLLSTTGTDSAGAVLYRATYARSASGRILATDTHYTAGATVKDKEGSQAYTYDYAGRLLTATNTQGVAGWSQTFSYDAAGRMRTNSLVGSYAYANPTVARHAPSTVTPSGSAAQALTYDPNGNMTAGLDGKVMAYDGENRPLSVTFAGKKTCFVYGADGARLKKIENFGTAQACSAPTSSQPVTVYLGPVEVRNFLKTTSEEMTLFPTPDVRIVRRVVSGNVPKVGMLHRDGLGSVRAVTAEDGLRNETDLYRPFGEQAETVVSAGAVREAKGYIGERYDADAGLLYLNARYYDPRLGMFLQPDWWEVTQEGVGTNRFAYAFNDPINGRDPTGHLAPALVGLAAVACGTGCEAVIGAGIAVGLDLLDNGVLDGSVLADPIDEALGLTEPEGFTSTPHGATVLGDPMGDFPIQQEGFTTTPEAGPSILSTPATPQEIRQNIVEASALRGALGLRPGDGWIAHHNIPQKFRNHAAVEAAIRAGYEFDGAVNGTRVLGQAGGHPRLNARIEKELDRILEEAQNNDWTDEQYREAIENLSEGERERIEDDWDRRVENQ